MTDTDAPRVLTPSEARAVRRFRETFPLHKGTEGGLSFGLYIAQTGIADMAAKDFAWLVEALSDPDVRFGVLFAWIWAPGDRLENKEARRQQREAVEWLGHFLEQRTEAELYPRGRETAFPEVLADALAKLLVVQDLVDVPAVDATIAWLQWSLHDDASSRLNAQRALAAPREALAELVLSWTTGPALRSTEAPDGAPGTTYVPVHPAMPRYTPTWDVLRELWMHRMAHTPMERIESEIGWDHFRAEVAAHSATTRDPEEESE